MQHETETYVIHARREDPIDVLQRAQNLLSKNSVVSTTDRRGHRHVDGLKADLASDAYAKPESSR